MEIVPQKESLEYLKSNVRLWRKSKENLDKIPWLKRANRGKKAAWPELEVDLLEWITEKWNNVLAILPSLVRVKALAMKQNETEWLVSSTKDNSCPAASR